jgi:hypothetical protein
MQPGDTKARPGAGLGCGLDDGNAGAYVSMQVFERSPLSLAAWLRHWWCSSQLLEQKSHFWISCMRRFLSMVQQPRLLDLLEAGMMASLYLID